MAYLLRVSGACGRTRQDPLRQGGPKVLAVESPALRLALGDRARGHCRWDAARPGRANMNYNAGPALVTSIAERDMTYLTIGQPG